MQEWYSVLFALLAIVGLLAFVCLVMSIFVQINEDGLDDVLNELEDRCEKENNRMINTIDEAIAHAREVAKEMRKQAAIGLDSMTDTIRVERCKECAREHEQLASWLEELKARREADRWIPVTERLPEKAGEYLCTLHYAIPPYHMFRPEKDVYVDAISVQGFDGNTFISSVIAWKPKPEPYESEAENDK